MAGEDSIDVKFVTITGKKFVKSVLPSQTIEEVIKEVAEQLDANPKCIKMVKGSGILKPEKTVADCGLKNNSVVKVVIRLLKVLTQEYMQGKWYVHEDGGQNTFVITVEENRLNDSYSDFQFEMKEYGIYIFDEGISFQEEYKIERLREDVICVTQKSNERTMFWVRNESEDLWTKEKVGKKSDDEEDS